MITDKLEYLFKYAKMFPEIEQLITYCKTNQLENIGEKTLFKDITIIPITSNDNHSFDEELLETHQKLMDIHITLEGVDCMAYSCVNNEATLFKDYDDGNDYLLLKSKDIKKIYIPAGYFCIVPNNFAHMALYATGKGVKKIVVKIPNCS